MSMTIDELQIEIQANSTNAASGIEALKTSLQGLSRIMPSVTKGGQGANATISAIGRLSKSLSTLSGLKEVPAISGVSELAASLQPLAGMKTSGFTNVVSGLKNISKITQSLDNNTLREFYNKIQSVTRIMAPLAAEMEKVSNGFSKLPTNIQRAINANAKLTTSNKKVGSSYGVMGTGIKQWVAQLGIAYIAARRVATVISKWITESNN